MSGELPSEARSLEAIKGLVERVQECLGDPETIDMVLEIDLPALHAVISGLYAIRGETDKLKLAAADLIVGKQEQEAIRAELLEKYGIGSDQEAAELIASHWQGERPEELLTCIMGFYTGTGERGPEIHRKAMHFAYEATAENPDEQRMLRNASNLLFRDYRGGHG